MAQKYTRNMIRNVFIEMLDERPFDEITVTDLVTRCEINRKTFYYYYQDLYAVLTEIFESELEAVLGGVKEHVTWEEGIAQAVQIALQHKRAVYHVYHSMQRETLEKYLYNVAGEVMRRYVERQSAGIPRKPGGQGHHRAVLPERADRNGAQLDRTGDEGRRAGNDHPYWPAL